MRKVCTKCGIEKELTEFYKDSSRVIGCRSACKQCESERESDWYNRNKDKINERRRELRKHNPEKYNEYHRKRRANFTEEQKRRQLDAKNDYRQRVASFIQSEKYPCIVCGEDDPVVLDWHHIDPATKSDAVARCRTFPLAKAEIAKCTCLCANCHRRHHAGTIDIEPYVTNHKQV